MLIASKIKQKLSSHFFFFTIALFVAVTSWFAYSRFMINHDYIVSYEGECDPSVNTCFTGCEDDECAEVYYYSIVHKYAQNLYQQCGKDITDCEHANTCLEGEKDCSVTYCEAAMGDETCSVSNNNASESNPDGGEAVEPLESSNKEI